MGRVRPARLERRRCGAAAHQPPCRDDDRLAPAADFLVCHRTRSCAGPASRDPAIRHRGPGARFGSVPRKGLPDPYVAVDSAAVGHHASARSLEIFGERQLERHLRSVPYHQRAARIRYALWQRSAVFTEGRYEGGGIRHRVRGVSCTGRGTRARECESAATLRAAFQRRRRFHHRAAAAARSASLVAGVRSVPQPVGVLRSRRRAPGQRRWVALSPGRRSLDVALYRAADAQYRLADDEGAAGG